MLPKQLLYRLNRTVTDTQPDEFRWVTEQQTALLEVRALGDNHKSMLLRILPDDGVRGPLSAQRPEHEHCRHKDQKAEKGGVARDSGQIAISRW